MWYFYRSGTCPVLKKKTSGKNLSDGDVLPCALSGALTSSTPVTLPDEPSLGGGEEGVSELLA